MIDSAILALVANKQGKCIFTQKQKSTNTLILILTLMMTFFAQVVTMLENAIPYALPVSLGGLAFYYAVRIVSLKGKKITESMSDLLKVILLGSIATATWAKFFTVAMDLFD